MATKRSAENSVAAEPAKRAAASHEAAEARAPKRKLALLLSYRGTAYHGLQRQNEELGLATIESTVQAALAAAGAVRPENQGDLSKIGWARSARTDKRVSAARNVVSCKLEVPGDDLAALVDRVNEHLPPDVRVFDAVRVVKSFDCKRACDRRQYTYLLPSCLLAPDAVLDAAFAAAGYGPDRVARARAAAAAAKAPGGAPAGDWQIDAAAAAAVAAALAPFRAGADTVARLREVLAAYARPGAGPAPREPPAAPAQVGTRRYHNFTARLRPDAGAAQRYILSFEAADPRAPAGAAQRGNQSFEVLRFEASAAGAEWLRLDVVGQSFLLHMIRKMVAVAAEAARVGRPASVLDGLTDPAHEICLQLVPGDGLYLGGPVFDSYNTHKASPPEKPRLDWGPDHPAYAAIEAFREDVIEDGILQGGASAALEPWVVYLWHVRVFGFPLSPEDPVPVPNLPRDMPRE